MFLFMTFYFQDVHGYSAVKSGLLFLPFSLGIIVSAGVTSQLLPKFGPRPLATIGAAMGAAGLFYLSMFHANSSYIAHVMPAMIVASLGMGFMFVSISSTALFNIAPEDTGAASAVLSTTQQVGGSFGTAIQNTIAVSSAAAFITGVSKADLANKAKAMSIHNEALVHGYSEAFRFGSAMMVVAGALFFLLVNIDRHHLGQHDDVDEMPMPAGMH